MKYKQGKKETSSSLYSTLPETLETLHAREASELQSEVRTPAAHLTHTHLTHTHLTHTYVHPSCVFPRLDNSLCSCLCSAEVQGGSEEGSLLQSVPPAARDLRDGPRQGSLRAAQRGNREIRVYRTLAGELVS